MIETLNQFALESLVESCETVAFLSPMPAEEPFRAPADAVLLSLGFVGRTKGAIEMVAPQGLGKIAAANMLGINPEAHENCEDILKELLNIFGGLTLRRWIAESHEEVEMSLPQMRAFDAAIEWQPFIGSPGATVLDVEGNTVALRVRGG